MSPSPEPRQPDSTTADGPQADGLTQIESWFAARTWSPFGFQRECWDAYRAGRSGLLHAPTGTGKTLAAWLGPVSTIADERLAKKGNEPLRVVWITPLRALAGDTVKSLLEPAEQMGLPISVELRTGDTSSSIKSRQRKRMPTALVTTPESLTILLSYLDSPRLFETLDAVIVDEWHELMGTKRGVQTELALARLRQWRPGLRTWGVSATLGNTDQAASVLLGSSGPGVLVKGAEPRPVELDTLIPTSVERYPWAGHLGTQLVDRVVERIDAARTTLMFCNTRSQAEIWFRRLLLARDDWMGRVGLHHGSLDRDTRRSLEAMLRTGEGQSESADNALKCVVCTSSLDLGVDFAPVDQVIQVGSPKGVARLMQRAGRSGHQPGRTSVIVGVPTHAFELVEFAAARDAIDAKHLESREPIDCPLDVLVQHLVTIAAAGGFDDDAMLAEVRTAHAYRELSDEAFQWALDFVSRGGPALSAYEKYARVSPGEQGRRIAHEPMARAHRMGIGTITGDQAIQLKYASGRNVGTIEESFISRLAPGDRFVFGGKVLELLRIRGLDAIVARSSKRSGAIPRWQGSRMPLSTKLAAAVRERLGLAHRGEYTGPEMQHARPLLELQKEVSRMPRPGVLVIERIKTRLGWHAFVYTFAGRLAHEGLAPLLGSRVTQRRTMTITTTQNDYGVELLADDELPATEAEWREVLSPNNLLDDLLRAMNQGEMARRAFRDVARVAGLTQPGLPGRQSTGRQLQASSDMFYDVLSEFDPENLLLDQARREVLEGQLEVRRLAETLEDAQHMSIELVELPTMSPMAFPLYTERIRATHLSSASWESRVREMVVELEQAAGGAP